jgi:DDE superfamily endonuclease
LIETELSGDGIGKKPREPSPMPLQEFRERLHGCLDKRADALFELTDAILTAGHVTSTVHLSLAAAHRRSWVSLYAALGKGRIDAESVRDLLVEQIPSYGIPEGGPAIFAVDRSVWSRCDAEASPERGYYHHPSRHSAGQPIVAGWAYQIVAQLSFERSSWVAPVDARRVKPEEDANDAAAGQIKALVSRFVRRDLGGGEEPLFVFDAGYDPVRLQRNLKGCSV